MSNTLSIGDVANLRSGGPAMTVAGFVNEDGTPMDGPYGFNSLVRCIWFDEGGRLQAHAFPHGLLDGASKSKDEPDNSAERRAKIREMERQGGPTAPISDRAQGQPKGQAQQASRGRDGATT